MRMRGAMFAHVDGAIQARERSVQVFPIAAAAQAGGGKVPGPDVAQAERGDEAPKFLDADGGAARDIVGDLFERDQRAFAAAVANRVGDFGAAIRDSSGQRYTAC